MMLLGHLKIFKRHASGTKFRMIQLKIQQQAVRGGSRRSKLRSKWIDQQIQVSTNAGIEANRQYAEEVGDTKRHQKCQ